MYLTKFASANGFATSNDIRLIWPRWPSRPALSTL